jgi:hypothetical protein
MLPSPFPESEGPGAPGMPLLRIVIRNHRAISREANMEDTKATGELFGALLSEVAGELGTISNGKDRDKLSQPERRMYVRSVFATIEAWIYVMKQMALAAHPDPECPTISESERAFAQEQEYRLTDSGDVEIRRAKISLEVNLRFAFKLFAKSGYVSSELDVSGSEWQTFRRAIKIRDRITHPKSVSDLNISDDDFKDATAGLGWILISHAELFTAIAHKAVNEAG